MDMSVDLTLTGINPGQFIRWLEHYLIHVKPHVSGYPIMPSKPGKRSLLFVDSPTVAATDDETSRKADVLETFVWDYGSSDLSGIIVRCSRRMDTSAAPRRWMYPSSGSDSR